MAKSNTKSSSKPGPSLRSPRLSTSEKNNSSPKAEGTNPNLDDKVHTSVTISILPSKFLFSNDSSREEATQSSDSDGVTEEPDYTIIGVVIGLLFLIVGLGGTYWCMTSGGSTNSTNSGGSGSGAAGSKKDTITKSKTSTKGAGQTATDGGEQKDLTSTKSNESDPNAKAVTANQDPDSDADNNATDPNAKPASVTQATTDPNTKPRTEPAPPSTGLGTAAQPGVADTVNLKQPPPSNGHGTPAQAPVNAETVNLNVESFFRFESEEVPLKPSDIKELPEVTTPAKWLEVCDRGAIKSDDLKRAQCVLALMKSKFFTFQRLGSSGAWTTEYVPAPEHLAWFVAMGGDVQPEAVSKYNPSDKSVGPQKIFEVRQTDPYVALFQQEAHPVPPGLMLHQNKITDWGSADLCCCTRPYRLVVLPRLCGTSTDSILKFSTESGDCEPQTSLPKFLLNVIVRLGWTVKQFSMRRFDTEGSALWRTERESLVRGEA